MASSTHKKGKGDVVKREPALKASTGKFLISLPFTFYYLMQATWSRLTSKKKIKKSNPHGSLEEENVTEKFQKLQQVVSWTRVNGGDGEK